MYNHLTKNYPPALLGAFRMPLAERAHIYAHNHFLTLLKVQINFARKNVEINFNNDPSFGLFNQIQAAFYSSSN